MTKRRPFSIFPVVAVPGPCEAFRQTDDHCPKPRLQQSADRFPDAVVLAVVPWAVSFAAFLSALAALRRQREKPFPQVEPQLFPYDASDQAGWPECIETAHKGALKC